MAAKLLEELASLYRGEGRNTEAIAALERSLDLTAPELPHNATTELATLLVKEGRLPEAKGLLESLLVRRYMAASSRPEIWMRGGVELQLGDINREMGETAEAEESYKESVRDLAVGPGEDPAYAAAVRLVNLYLREGRVADAREACDGWQSTLSAGSATAAMCARLDNTSDGPVAPAPE